MAVAEVRERLPRSIGGLAKVFPVLLRVPAVADPSSSSDATIEPQELQSVPSAGLRALLGRLGARHPLVLLLDDLQ